MNYAYIAFRLAKKWCRPLYLMYRHWAYARQLRRLSKHRKLAQKHGKTLVHFLHTGKTGGSAIKAALGNREAPYFTDKYIIVSHGHWFRLKDAKRGEKVFFFVRDPVDRFVSGFYCRKRKSRPHNFGEWNSGERVAFRMFPTANELANALSSTDRRLRREAVRAMYSIIHVHTSYWDWFSSSRYMLKRLDDILFVGTQENLKKDFERLKEVLGLPQDLKLPNDEKSMNKSSKKENRHLDQHAIQNLKRWYATDYEFMRLLRDKNLLPDNTETT